ncbi:MAG: N-6 DNA methylase [Ilumatobacter sp.]
MSGTGEEVGGDDASKVASADRKRRGAWFTPDHLVAQVVDAVVDDEFVRRCAGRRIRVLDPACGDGRFLVAAGAAIRSHRGEPELVGVDIDASTVASIDPATGIKAVCADALVPTWHGDHGLDEFDLIIGNPPYLSQMSSATTRGGSSRRGGGPYADAAAEFLSLGAELVRADGGRLAYVLPQSILTVRDAEPIRRDIDERSTMFWSTWTGERDFDAQVVTCAVAFEFSTDRPPPFGHPQPSGNQPSGNQPSGNWSSVVTTRSGVPAMAAVFDHPHPPAGRLGDRARLNANFRDEYYGMVPAVGDHEQGPALITSGLIDPGVCRWGERSVRFAKQRFDAPRIDLSMLDDKMLGWARKRLIPKVLIANQTRVIEAVCDPSGAWLPGVPVVAAYPTSADPVEAARVAWEITAVLLSPSVSVWAWHQRGGTGLSSNTIRVGPTMLADLVWPAGSLDAAVSALQACDVVRAGVLADEAYGIDAQDADEALAWWRPVVERINGRP